MKKWKKTRTVLHGSFENHEGREPVLWKNTHMHKMSLFLRFLGPPLLEIMDPNISLPKGRA